MSQMMLLGLVAAPVLALFAAAYWRKAVLLAMLLVVFEGALRKWVLPGAQAQLYLLKDLILIGAYVGFTYSGSKEPLPPAFRFLAKLSGIFALYGALEILNPSSPSFLVGLIGWKAYFLYMPLAWVVPALFRSIEETADVLKQFLIIGIPVAILGFIQFASPADSLVNEKLEVQGLAEVTANFGEELRQRTSGTFSFITGYTEYLTTLVLLALCLLGAGKWRIRGNVLTYVAMVAAIGALFTTGSRGPFVQLVVAFLLILALQLRAGDVSPSIFVRVVVLLVAGGVVLTVLAPGPIEAFFHRVDTAGDDAIGRALENFVVPFEYVSEAGLAGFGIGTTHNSALFLTGAASYSWLKGIDVEFESARVMVELGVIGFMLQYGLQIYVLASALHLSRTLSTPAGRNLAVSISALLFIHLASGTVNNPPANLIQWFAIGLLVLAGKLDGVIVGSSARDSQARGHVGPAMPSGASS